MIVHQKHCEPCFARYVCRFLAEMFQGFCLCLSPLANHKAVWILGLMGKMCFFKILNFILAKNYYYFYMFLDYFDVFILKKYLKKKHFKL
jgi:hypothetical protein